MIQDYALVLDKSHCVCFILVSNTLACLLKPHAIS